MALYALSRILLQEGSEWPGGGNNTYPLRPLGPVLLGVLAAVALPVLTEDWLGSPRQNFSINLTSGLRLCTITHMQLCLESYEVDKETRDLAYLQLKREGTFVALICLQDEGNT